MARDFGTTYTSILMISPYAKYFYGFCLVGMVIGIVFARGRVRLLVTAGVAALGTFALYAASFLLSERWWLPLPFYIEHALSQLFVISAVAGYWSAAQRIPMRRASLAISAVAAIATPLVILLILAERSKYTVVTDSITAARHGAANLADHLADQIGLEIGKPYRGSVAFPIGGIDILEVIDLWKRGVPTAFQYSQLITPQSMYLEAALFNGKPVVNGFVPWGAASRDIMLKTLRAMGARFFIDRGAVEELPSPNLGNYTPTDTIRAGSALDIVRTIANPGFDFRRHVITADDHGNLVPARDVKLIINRGGGFHVTGNSDGASLILLPLQYSHCLAIHDTNARIIRADLFWAGLVFSGAIDSDVSFSYGMLSPKCRRADLDDVKRLQMTLPVR